jgi:ABC-type bacteriocin/lantibiotic exporter with double-glycine peptidase domain
MTTTVLPSAYPSHEHSSRLDDVIRVVEIAARVEELEVDTSAMARTAARVDADFGRHRPPFVVLAATCAEHGLSTHSVQCGADELIEQVDEGVTMAVEREGASPSWLVFAAHAGSSSIQGYEVAGGRVRSLPAPRRNELVGLVGDRQVNALLIESRFPLDALGSTSGGPVGGLRRLWRLARLERSELITVFIYAVFIGLLTLVMPVSVQALVNTIAFGSVLQPLIILGLALFAGLVISAVFQGLRHHVVELLQRRIFVRVVNDFGRRIPRWSADVAREQDTRELANRFFDVVSLQKSAAALSVDALGLTLQTAMGLLLLAFYHPVLLAFDVVLVLALLAIVVLPMRGSAATAIAESKAKYATAAWLETIADNGELFADARGARHASARADQLTRNYLHAREAHWRHLLRHIAGGLSLQVIASVALLMVGGWLVMERQLTLGQLVASELVVAAIGAGFGKLGKQMEKLYDAAASVQKLSKLVDVRRERDGGVHVVSANPVELDLHQLSDPRLACDLDLEVPAGDSLALSGSAASGKSTLMHMLMGRLLPERGRVMVDGVDLAQAHLPHFRASVCWLDDRGRVPSMTVAELLRMHAPDTSSADLRQALRHVGLGPAVERLPEGLDTKLLPDGGPLSRRELLRLSIARLLLQRPRLVLADGTLDALADDEALIGLVLDGPWTVVVTTRDSRIARRASHSITLQASND